MPLTKEARLYTGIFLKGRGTIQDDSEEWMIAEMRERKAGRHDLTRTVGRGSGSKWRAWIWQDN